VGQGRPQRQGIEECDGQLVNSFGLAVRGQGDAAALGQGAEHRHIVINQEVV
jgi:hypothetical protein